MNYNCKIVNTVWIDRGIKITILYYIINNYDDIINKHIIIKNKNYRHFVQKLFPELYFTKDYDSNNDNFIFNIKNVIKKQDVFIDYINNYDDYINSSKLNLVPWYNISDPLISFIYNKKKKLKISKYNNFIIEFTKCKRGNYKNNQIWDIIQELNIFDKYKKIKPSSNMNKVLKIFYESITKNLNNKIIYNQKPQIIYRNNYYDVNRIISIYMNEINSLKQESSKIKSLDKKKYDDLYQTCKEIIKPLYKTI